MGLLRPFNCTFTRRNMPRLLTTKLGEVDYTDDSVFRFPTGLPGFEDQRSFVFLRRPATEPLIFMQSMSAPDLCFILLPILVADPNYRLEISAEDAEELGLAMNLQPAIGKDVLCAAMVCAGGNVTPTVNLMAPIVVNFKDRIGMQIIRSDSGYSHQVPLIATEQVTCS